MTLDPYSSSRCSGPSPRCFPIPETPMVTGTKIPNTNIVERCHVLLLAHYLICMTAGSVSKIAHTWPERDAQFVTTFLHQMLTATLIKFPVNPYEILHAPKLNSCHFNFRLRHSLVLRYGLACTHTRTHVKPAVSHASHIPLYLILS